jgi:hypothetical protein
MKKKEPTIIGAVDKVDLPEFKLLDIGCRVDTGAALCAIHCHHVQLITKNGVDSISFKLLDPTHDEYQQRTYTTTHFIEKRVKSSFGNVQYRYAITTPIVIFGQLIETEITLADRESMQYPLLIGRNLLRNGFLVNIRKRNLSWKKKQP